ncbi:uncharacterized protein LOC106459082 isoform X4 [Limulus polyphemus]|uniref:Uncharacterized protein LOC106459082 isoform X4 n=1 Tax=Limulus polyphemus TaxID=6850 RepID=A0ABM1SC41_LIMPO|nr:uncharacterized protein LOC106459082 isoform X4 [Limulus polyphemus]
MNSASVTCVLLIVCVVLGMVKVGKANNCDDSTNATAGLIDFKIPKDTTCTITISPVNTNLLTLGEVFIFFESVSLSGNDNFTLRDNNDQVLFGPFIGSQDPFMVLSGTMDLAIVVLTGSDDTSTRNIRLHYSSKECSYDNHDRRIKIHYGKLQSPLYSKRKKETTCVFRMKPQDPGKEKLLVKFVKFHLNDSKLTVVGSDPKDYELSGSSLPSDIISKSELNMTLTLSSSQPGEQIVFILDTVSKGCSKNEEISNLPVTVTSADLTGEKCLRIIHSDEKTVLERYIRTSGNSVMISYLNPSVAYLYPLNISIQITSHSQGGYFKNSGSIQSTSKEDAVFLLQVEEGEQIMLNVSNSSFTPMSHIYIYSDFYKSSSLIADFTRGKKSIQLFPHHFK